jgi:hypothetical protein
MGASVSCTLRDYKGKSSIVTVDVTGTPTLAKAKALADFLKTHSDAKVIGYGISQNATVEDDQCDAGKYDRVEQKLVFLFSEKDGSSRRFSIPAPRDEDVDVDQEGDSDVAEDINDLLKSIGATKENMRFNGAGLTSKMPKSRKVEKTGV